jgi:hypothetical protein
MDEIFVVLGALIILVLSIAGMKIYRWRTDVLTGPYISNRVDHLTVPDQRTDRLNRPTAEKTRTMRYLKETVGRLTAKCGLTRKKPAGHGANKFGSILGLKYRSKVWVTGRAGRVSEPQLNARHDEAAGRYTAPGGLTSLLLLTSRRMFCASIRRPFLTPCKAQTRRLRNY